MKTESELLGSDVQLPRSNKTTQPPHILYQIITFTEEISRVSRIKASIRTGGRSSWSHCACGQG